jgi:hypothetical protein
MTSGSLLHLAEQNSKEIKNPHLQSFHRAPMSPVLLEQSGNPRQSTKYVWSKAEPANTVLLRACTCTCRQVNGAAYFSYLNVELEGRVATPYMVVKNVVNIGYWGGAPRQRISKTAQSWPRRGAAPASMEYMQVNNQSSSCLQRCTGMYVCQRKTGLHRHRSGIRDIVTFVTKSFDPVFIYFFFFGSTRDGVNSLSWHFFLFTRTPTWSIKSGQPVS